jgi:FMN phosphatase YigB (HAD superfamily)
MILIFDFNRTIFNPDSGALFADALPTLQALRERGAKLGLVSRREGSRDSLISRLGIRAYFDCIELVDEKTVATFRQMVATLGSTAAAHVPERVLVVGDRLVEEIGIGRALGYETAWFDPSGRVTTEADHSIRTLSEVLQIAR